MRLTRAARARRNAAIVRAAACRSRRDLALAHRLTERHVYRIIAAARRALKAAQ